MSDDCYSVLKILPYDNVSSSMNIALRFIECSQALFGDSKLKAFAEELLAHQSSMAVVINAALTVLEAIDRNAPEKITRFKQLLVSGEGKALSEACVALKGVRSLATYSASSTVEKLIGLLGIERLYLSVAHPAREGEKMADRIVSKKSAECVLFEDSGYSLIMRNVDAVVVGADAIFDDAFVNKTGTLQVALLARYYGKPFYVVGCLCKYLDDKAKKLFKIRPMPAEEISSCGCDRVNYYFESVPLALVNALFRG